MYLNIHHEHRTRLAVVSGLLLTLVFPIPSLNLLMHPFLHLPLQDPCSSWFVIFGDFENVGGIYVVVVASAHDMVSFDIELEHWDLKSPMNVSTCYDRQWKDLHRYRWQNICRLNRRAPL